MAKDIEQAKRDYEAAQTVAKVIGGREATRQAEDARQALADAVRRR